MNTRHGRTILVVAMLAFSGIAAPADPPQVRVRLVAESARLEPGDEVRVGVLFEISPGWHIYWRNPGDSGLATDVVLSLPDGFEAGELSWPTPVRFVQPGDLVGYGYESSVMLAAEVRVPRGWKGEAVKVIAEVSWLACRDVCVLGSASLEESWPLPVAEVEFDRWRSELPGGDPPFAVSTTGGIPPAARRGEVSIWLQWPEQPAGVEFFPAAGDGIKVADVKVQTRGSLTRVDLTVTVLGSGVERVPGLGAVVVTGGTTGPRRSWSILVPIARPLNPV